jgi:hypothetical protein
MIDKLLLVKAKNCKQRKLANIRARNGLNRILSKDSSISYYKIIGVKIHKGVQSIGVKICRIQPVKSINITLGFNDQD